MPYCRKHHGTRDRNLDRALDSASCHSGQHRVRPWEELAPETRPAEWRNDVNIFERNPDHFRHHVLMVNDSLSGLIERDLVPIPHGNGAMHFHGIMRLGGSGIRDVNLHWRSFKCSLRIAPRIVPGGRACRLRNVAYMDYRLALRIIDFDSC